ncbi:MAG TPA: hypothetical protein VG917_04785 [Patescibacteria group bacterium]|nr:hypothetical protein [Patescibacteria group bacterium]
MVDVGILKIRKSSLVSFTIGLIGAMFMAFFQMINFNPVKSITPFISSQVESIPYHSLFSENNKK